MPAKLNKLEFIGALSLFFLAKGIGFDSWDLYRRWEQYSTANEVPRGFSEFFGATLSGKD